MRARIRSTHFLNVAAFVSFAAAVVLSLPVVERLSAAAWQWYKFSDYPGAGHIDLSLNTGVVFSCVLAVVFFVAFVLNRVARLRAANSALKWSRRAMYVVLAVAISYWLLGVSNLNVWRA